MAQQIEEIPHRWCCATACALLAGEILRRRDLGQRRRDDRRGRHRQHVEIGEPRVHRADELARARASCRCSRRRRSCARARGARARFGSMSSPRRVEPVAVDGEGFRRQHAALGVDLDHRRRAAAASRRDSRAPAFSAASSASGKRLPTVSSRLSSGMPCATPMRKPASGAGSSGARLLARHHRVGLARNRRPCAPSARSSRA